MTERRHRTTWARGSVAMCAETFVHLYALLEARYPGRVRRVLEVTPVAVQKTIDNEADAQQTIDNILRAREKSNA